MRKIRGVSPIISVLLLIVIAVAAAVVTYGFVMGFIGTTTTTTTGRTAMINIEAVYYKSNYNLSLTNDIDVLTVYVRNVGQIPVNVSAVYVYYVSNNSIAYVNTSLAYRITPNNVQPVNVSADIDLKPGETYYVKVTTIEGAQASSEPFTVG